jgi:HTH-type transcriptional regulator / antitoxin HigA
MTADLVTKNKIAKYIELYPEAKTNILLWVKEFGRRFGRDLENGHFEGVTEVGAQLGASDFRIKFNFNPWVKTAYITWFGTNTDLLEQHKKEMEELRAQNPELIFEKVVSYKEVITSPPPPLEEQILPEPANLHGLEGNLKSVSTSDKIFTESEYEGALERVIEIFNASPETPEFAEIELLLPLIKNYEENKIALPALDPVALAKVRMKELQLTPQHLASLAGEEEEEMNLFLEGKKALSTDALRKLFHHLGIRHVDISELLN